MFVQSDWRRICMKEVYNTMNRNEIISELDNIIDNLFKLRTASKEYFREYSEAIDAFVDGNNILKVMTKEGKISTKNAKNLNSGAYWTKSEEKLMIHEYANGTSIEDISKMLGRTVDAIKLRMVKLNIIRPSKKLAEKYGLN